jgi:hypothetical protein
MTIKGSQNGHHIFNKRIMRLRHDQVMLIYSSKFLFEFYGIQQGMREGYSGPRYPEKVGPTPWAVLGISGPNPPFSFSYPNSIGFG